MKVRGWWGFGDLGWTAGTHEGSTVSTGCLEVVCALLAVLGSWEEAEQPLGSFLLPLPHCPLPA